MSQLNVSTVRNLAGTGTPDTNQLGQNQTYQDVTASRVANTNYTNTTGRPIFVSVNASGAQRSLTLVVDGINVSSSGVDASLSNNGNDVQAIVPPGSVYSVTNTFNVWIELR